MRILHVVPGISQTSGGPRNLIGLVRSLTEHGVDTTLITTNVDAGGQLDVPLHRRVVMDGATHIFHPVSAVGGRYGLALSMVRTLRDMIGACDLVHIHWLYNFSCIAAARVAIGAGVPYVIQPHGSLDPHLRRKNWLVKLVYMATVGRPLLRKAAAVVFDTPEEGQLASYGTRRPEWVLPTGVDPSQFEPLPPRGTFRAAFPGVEGPFLLFLGRISPQKGLDLLLGAFARVLDRRPDHWLVIAGPDYRGFESQVRSMARDAGVAHRVVFTGLLTHEMKLAALAEADLFVLPSYAENFGTVIMEALICGLPVLTSNQVNIHRELSAAGVAHVVDCSVDSVAAGIESALADPGARQRIAALGPAFVHAHYTWDAIVPGVVASYEDVIARAAGSHTGHP